MDEEIKEIKVENAVEAPAKKSQKKIILLGVLAVLVLTIGIPLIMAYNDGKVLYQKALTIKDAAKSQDVVKTQEAIAITQAQLKKVRRDLTPLVWTKFIIPYSSDLFNALDAGQQGLEAADILTKAVEPYADLLGFKGQGSFTGGTTEERIVKVVETLDKITPQIDALSQKISLARADIDKIGPNPYPKKYQEKIKEIKQLVDLIDQLLTQAKPMVKRLPDLAGVNGEKKYLVLFQNDAELRPTGGFITAYAVFRIEKGKIHLETSDDIYKLDDTLIRQVAPPDPISRYLNVYGWRMRDANFSPDFYSSMKTFEDLYASSSAKQKIDGIIALDTHVLVTLMDVLGPVNTYGTDFTTKKVPQCDCPMVIYELEKYADEPKSYERGSRKDIIGVLLQTLMQKIMAAPRQIYGPLFQAFFKEAQEKHILFYLHNQDAQDGLEAINWAGRIKTYDGDYLHVNDANLAGAKSNLYLVPSVKQEITVTDNGAEETLTLDYKYPRGADNCSLERKTGLCLAGIYRDYLRIYLPKGAVLVNSSGFENKSKTFEDLNHTVIDGFFTVVPQGLAKITIKYRISGEFKKFKEYKSLIQKQPGTDGNHYQVIVNNKSQEFNLTEDKEINVKL
ncbi:DUF4012 domain-containing protein [Candidatus Gottesmanbacteria bacterium]|nr:DUF4012 domain-containing protein [Candidatus Gottesmanbacteria bacterium]